MALDAGMMQAWALVAAGLAVWAALASPKAAEGQSSIELPPGGRGGGFTMQPSDNFEGGLIDRPLDGGSAGRGDFDGGTVTLEFDGGTVTLEFRDPTLRGYLPGVIVPNVDLLGREGVESGLLGELAQEGQGAIQGDALQEAVTPALEGTHGDHNSELGGALLFGGWAPFASRQPAFDFEELRGLGIDPNVFNPQGIVDPTCGQDACACGWCPEDDPFGSGKGDICETLQCLINRFRQQQGSVLMPDPTCRQDPCACAYCLPEAPGRIGGVKRPGRSGIVPVLGGPLAASVAAEIQADVPALPPAEAPKAVKEAAHATITLNDHLNGRRLVDRGSFCPDQGRRPWSMTRESYFSRVTAAVCTRAVFELNAFHADERARVERLFGFAPDPNVPLIVPDDLAQGSLPEDQEARARAAFVGYANACLTELAEVTDRASDWETPTSNFLNLASAPGSVAALMNSVGTLSVAGRNADPCSGSLADLGGRTYLLAAMHCVGTEISREAEQTTFDGVWPALQFTTYAGHEINLDVDPSLAEASYDADRHDVFAVEITSGDIPKPIVTMATVPLEAWEPMLIVGRNVYLAARARDAGIRGAELRRASVGVQSGADCRARTLDRGHLRYRCQTEKGTSGGGIYAYREGRFVLAGLHMGAIGSGPRPLSCASGMGQGGANRGISLRYP